MSNPHEKAMLALRERCLALHQQLGRDGMLRQNDPVETIFTFAKSLIEDREYVIGFNDGFEEARAQIAALVEKAAQIAENIEFPTPSWVEHHAEKYDAGVGAAQMAIAAAIRALAAPARETE